MNELLLENKVSKVLYKSIKDLPIIDYHNHLSPQEIYENKPFNNITEMFLDHDHYKWRLMRFSGKNSHNEDPLQRFIDYIEALETAYLSPLYIWTKMELKTFFNIELDITLENAEEIYNLANKVIEEKQFGPRDILNQMKVEVACTTDDIMDSLQFHKLIRDEITTIKVLPTFRPDRVFTNDANEFQALIESIEEKFQTSLEDLRSFEEILRSRIRYFEDAGCKLADHGITFFKYEDVTYKEANGIFLRRYHQNDVSTDDVEKLNSYILKLFFSEYSKRNWTVQLHLGALRNQNTKAFNEYGRDAGFDSVSGHNYTEDLNKFLDSCNQDFDLPRSIIYPLNINHYEEIASLCGNFSTYKEGHIQLGAAWWMNDHLTGIIKQLQVFSEYLNIGKLLGMLTDSRSYLSMIRHDYYRRILCSFIGENVEKGFIPLNTEKLIKLVKDIAYYNSKNYLNL